MRSDITNCRNSQFWEILLPGLIARIEKVRLRQIWVIAMTWN